MAATAADDHQHLIESAPSSASGTLTVPLPAAAAPISMAALQHAMGSGELTPSGLIKQLFARRAQLDRPEIWICQPSDAELLAAAERLEALLAAEGAAIFERLPLFGLPFAVKDNIDVAEVPTTAACPAFAYRAERSAPAVERLLHAGAQYVGKTNLDQFATGLVGTRSPYGAVRNALNPEFISGGSSSGSAVAVALGLACFALGTDTAGSGRVPAGLNGIVGLKPTRGLVSTTGVVPACRSLDCVSIFAVSVDDAWRVLQVIAGPDAADAYSRAVPQLPPLPRDVRIGLVASDGFFGDDHARKAYGDVLDHLCDARQCRFEDVDIAPLSAAADLLYQGPWIAERGASIGNFAKLHPDAIDPAVLSVLAGAGAYSAEDAFAAQYQMAKYRAYVGALFDSIDVLLVPTAPNHPRLSAVAADPIGPNTQLGRYTNFVNLLDLAAIAIPGTTRGDGLPFGLTLIGPAGSDHRLATLAGRLLEVLGHAPAGTEARLARDPLAFAEPVIDVAVVGAHLDGQPLNWQMLESGARRTATTRTAASYELHALANTTPPKPGLVRVAEGGVAIEIEVWQIPQRQFGLLMSRIGPPLGIGSLELADGRWVKGFICEPCALAGAADITQHGGWRAYLAAPAAP